jgi:hypothetical protein
MAETTAPIHSPKCLTTSRTPFDFAQSPLVWFLVLVEQWFDLLLLLSFANFVTIGDLKELWSSLNEPFGFHSSDIDSIFAGRVQQFVINKPFGTTIEQC